MGNPDPASPPSPWHAAYPAPRHSQLEGICREAVLEMTKLQEKEAGKDFVLIDLQRNDHEVILPLFHWLVSDKAH